jgi:putative membrane protein
VSSRAAGERVEGSSRLGQRAGRAAFALTGAAMVVTPLLPRGRRTVAASCVVGGLAATTTLAAARRWGPERALAALATVAAATALIEKLGSSTGLPFGRYRYTGALRPTAAGIPILVPLAWHAMALPAREAAHAALGRRSTASARIVAGSAALMAWDLFLDPQMVGEGYWEWARRGRYRGIPVTNQVGWLLTGLGLMAALERLAPVPSSPGEVDRVLVSEYAWMAVMETLGFALFFRDRVVAAVGGAAMLPVAVLAARRAWARG